MAAEPLPEDLRAALDSQKVRTLVEYLAVERLGLRAGHVELAFSLSFGSLREAQWHRRRVRVEELEAAAVTADG
jgi:hypothetical protein